MSSQGGYGQYNPYGQGQQGYGQSPYQQSDNMEQGNGGYEMDSYGQEQSGPTALLNKCREINDGIANVRTTREGQLTRAQNALLGSINAADDKASREAVERIENEINTDFRSLRDLLKKVKQTPGSGDSRVQTQIDVTNRNLRREIEQYQRSQSDFQKRLREQVRRQYELAHADEELTGAEIDQGVDNIIMGQELTFQVSGQRLKDANEAKAAVSQRSAAIRKIEQDMIELARLYQEVAELVHQQEPAVEQIHRGAEDVAGNVQQANTQITSAIKSARNARKWKWYALIIILIIIGIVVGVAVGVSKR